MQRMAGLELKRDQERELELEREQELEWGRQSQMWQLLPRWRHGALRNA